MFKVSSANLVSYNVHKLVLHNSDIIFSEPFLYYSQFWRFKTKLLVIYIFHRVFEALYRITDVTNCIKLWCLTVKVRTLDTWLVNNLSQLCHDNVSSIQLLLWWKTFPFFFLQIPNFELFFLISISLEYTYFVKGALNLVAFVCVVGNQHSWLMSDYSEAARSQKIFIFSAPMMLEKTYPPSP